MEARVLRQGSNTLHALSDLPEKEAWSVDARRACCTGEAPEGLFMLAKSGPLPNAKPSLDLTKPRNLPTSHKTMDGEHYH